MGTQIKTEPGKKIRSTGIQKITPFLWFDNQAEEASKFYTSVFRNSEVKTLTRYGESGAKASGREKGSVMTVAFQLEGQEFVALNGGPVFEITPAISFFVSCNTHQEIDTLWDKLSKGGSVLMQLDKYPFGEKFGWVKDKFGVTWQLMLVGGMQKITTYLMFTGDQKGKAEEAMKFYISLFKNSGLISLERYGKGEPEPEGKIKHARFSLDNQDFIVMDSYMEHNFGFTTALSLVVNCESQQEIDHFWDKLCEGGDERAQQCGWLQDKYGVSWQIIPVDWDKIMKEANPEKSDKIMQAVLQMKKIDINTVMRVYNQL